MLGSLAGISIERLLIGGILPGMLMAAGFLAYVVVRSRLRPQDAPMSDDDPATRLKGWALWKPFVFNVVPLLGIFIAVVGSMLAGWASPTESAAIGVVASVLATIAYRALTLKALWKSLIETAKANGQEPYAYLRHILERLPAASSVEDYEALLPWNCSPVTAS